MDSITGVMPVKISGAGRRSGMVLEEHGLWQTAEEERRDTGFEDRRQG